MACLPVLLVRPLVEDDGSMPPGRCALPWCCGIVRRGPAGEAAPARSLSIRAAPALQGLAQEALPHQPATVPYRAGASGSSSHPYGCPFCSSACGAAGAPIAICARVPAPVYTDDRRYGYAGLGTSYPGASIAVA